MKAEEMMKMFREAYGKDHDYEAAMAAIMIILPVETHTSHDVYSDPIYNTMKVTYQNYYVDSVLVANRWVKSSVIHIKWEKLWWACKAIEAKMKRLEQGENLKVLMNS